MWINNFCRREEFQLNNHLCAQLCSEELSVVGSRSLQFAERHRTELSDRFRKSSVKQTTTVSEVILEPCLAFHDPPPVSVRASASTRPHLTRRPRILRRRNPVTICTMPLARE